MADRSNLVVMKDTSTDAERMQAIGRAVRPGSIARMQGREPLILASLAAGAGGCVTALHRMVPGFAAEAAFDQAIDRVLGAAELPGAPPWECVAGG